MRFTTAEYWERDHISLAMQAARAILLSARKDMQCHGWGKGRAHLSKEVSSRVTNLKAKSLLLSSLIQFQMQFSQAMMHEMFYFQSKQRLVHQHQPLLPAQTNSLSKYIIRMCTNSIIWTVFINAWNETRIIAAAWVRPRAREADSNHCHVWVNTLQRRSLHFEWIQLIIGVPPFQSFPGSGVGFVFALRSTQCFFPHLPLLISPLPDFFFFFFASSVKQSHNERTSAVFHGHTSALRWD